MPILRAPSSQTDTAPPTQATQSPERGAPDSMRHIVRAATRNHHKLIDQEISKLDLADRVGYGIFLNIHYLALSALVGRWNARDQPEFMRLFLCLVDDLQALNCPVNPAPPAAWNTRAVGITRS